MTRQPVYQSDSRREPAADFSSAPDRTGDLHFLLTGSDPHISTRPGTDKEQNSFIGPRELPERSERGFVTKLVAQQIYE
ncbi:uncharacterized protein METZ01_LOCUS473798, partial [marine metagenome]